MYTRFTLILAAVIYLFALGGCSVSPGKNLWKKDTNLNDYNPANFQGCTVAEYIQPVESDVEGGEAFTMRWWGCQDKATVSATLDLDNNGTPDFTYNASDVQGSVAAKVRADVEKVFSDNSVPVSESAIDAIVNIVTGGAATVVP